MAEAELETLTEARPSRPSPRVSSRTRYNQTMRLLRRVHLYSGLFMTPWVFLYGITALLFNHPDSFPDQEIRKIDSATLRGTPLGDLPKPEVLATQVLAAINAQRPDGRSIPSYRLSGPGEARFSRELFATVKGEGRDHTVRLDLESGEGSVRSSIPRERMKAAPPSAPFARREGVELETPLLADITGSLPKVLGNLGLSGKDVEVRFLPDVVFPVEGGGKTWNVTYNPRTGSVSGRPADGPSGGGQPISGRRFLTRLHTAHGYPSSFNARWAWAVAVDLMFASMVGWGITGLLMWWQMKNVRRVGAVVLVLSALVATAVAFGMHAAMTSDTPAEGGGRGGAEVRGVGKAAPSTREDGREATPGANGKDAGRARPDDEEGDESPRRNRRGGRRARPDAEEGDTTPRGVGKGEDRARPDREL